MNRLLLLGGSHSEIPLIQAAKKLGFWTITTGNRPWDLGHAFADEFVLADYSDIQTMVRLARELDLQAVCSGCNDFAAISASAVAEELNLPGHDSFNLTAQIHHKDSFYTMAKNAGVPVPLFHEVQTVEDAVLTASTIGYPVMLKPIDLTGGKGISVVHTADELYGAWNRSAAVTRKSSMVIQKRISGSNHAISALIRDRRVVFSFVDVEHYYSNPFLVGGASYPPEIGKQLQERISSALQQFAVHHDLTDGLLHIQFIVDSNSDFFFIDVCRRPPGDLYVKFVELAVGIAYSELIVRCQSGLPWKVPTSLTESTVSRLCLMPERSGVFGQMEEIPGPGTVLEITPLMNPGHHIENHLIEKVAIVQMAFESNEDMRAVMQEPLSRFRIAYRP